MAEEATEPMVNETIPADVAAEAAPAAKPRRRRKVAETKADAAPEAVASDASVAPEPAQTASVGGEAAAEPPKRRRGRPRMTPEEKAAAAAARAAAKAAKAQEDAAAEPQGEMPTREAEPAAPAVSAAGASEGAPAPESGDAAAPEPQVGGTFVEDAPRRRRTRTRTQPAAAEPQVPNSIEEMTKMTQAATVASAVIMEAPAATLAEADTRASEPSEGGEQQPRSRRRRGQDNAQQGDRQRQQQQQQQQQGGQSKRQKNRRNRKDQQATGPSVTREELEALKVADLRAKAAELEVDYAGLRKAELVEAVYQANARAEGFRPVAGVIEIQSEGYAFLRTGNYMPGEDDAFVHQQLIRSYALRPGDWVEGSLGPSRSGNKYPPLQKIDTINGHAPEDVRNRPRFRDLTPVYPDERLVMEHGKDSTTGRAIDLVAPIGKGQRGLIVSPPKAGKTTVLKRICQAIAVNNPEVHLFCLLVDERPEEVTDMERSIRGTVVASTFDMPAENHTAVAELVIEHAKRLVELGEDVVVVLDSITRLARAYNLAQPASGRILSGGVDSAALYPPKRFLGAARNIEHGGSLTILASALVDTGSKMDEVIFEEFKGTGNMELKLDRDLADKRIFPAIDPVASGTRNEDLLIVAEMQPFVWGLRRVLANMNNTERAATALVKSIKATNTNQELLIRSAKKAQQSDYTL